MGRALALAVAGLLSPPVASAQEKAPAVLDRLRDAAAKMPADGRWLIAWDQEPPAKLVV